MSKTPDNLAHRDDMPDELIEGLQEMFPGMKIVFAGDAPRGTLPNDIVEMAREIESAHMDSLMNGKCADCGAEMDGYPKTEDEWDDFEIPEGWFYYTDAKGEPTFFVCPKCDSGDVE